MEITIQVPEPLGKVIKSFEGSESLILEALEAIGRTIVEKKDPPVQEEELSKWAKIAKRIRNDSEMKKPENQEAWQQMKKDMKEEEQPHLVSVVELSRQGIEFRKTVRK